MQDAISYISHSDIDKKKWNDCVQQAINGLVYAHSDYLDTMSPEWDALVYGDYEAIMPVTWRSKMGVRYVCQPAFAQQLGVFYINDKYRTLVPAFLTKLSLKYKLVEIFLNYDNASAALPAQHQNFVLDLSATYDVIRSDYKNDLLKNLKRTEKFNLVYEAKDTAKEAIQLYKASYADRMHIREQDFEWFTDIVQLLMTQNLAFVRAIRLPSGKLLSMAVFLNDGKRIYNIASTTLPDGRTLEANHFLMDELIREFAGSGLVLDFEGSDLAGVARFYKKFSPTNQPYAFWKTNRLPAVLRWWKK